ncbi:hypothetical protein IWX83_002794 [Flavobacterium sp. CG_9.1]|nr:hypothetical protein [Flavobacterium sp. CG_9.1]
MGIAERTPKRRASYEQEATTPRSPPPIINGIPSSFELFKRSQETKKVSKSICTIARAISFLFRGQN